MHIQNVSNELKCPSFVFYDAIMTENNENNRNYQNYVTLDQNTLIDLDFGIQLCLGCSFNLNQNIC